MTKEIIVEVLKNLIKIDTRTSVSNETQAAIYLKSIFDEADIECEIVEPVKGKGSFIAHIQGSDTNEKELLLLSHLDTDEFGDIKKWKFHPLSGEEYKDMILGRGAIDCKGLVSLFASIMIKIKKSGKKPRRGIIFAAVADEENGGKHGMEYLIENNKLIKNCECVIGEGGGFPIKIGNTTYFTCQTGEIHANAGKNRGLFINLFNGILIKKIYNFNLIIFLIRQFFSKSLKRRLDISGFLYDGNSIGHTKTNTDLYRTIVSETSKISKNYEIIPVTTPGYSDNRFLRYKNKTVYGYFPLSLNDRVNGIHGCNERISIKGLIETQQIMYGIVSKFVNYNY